MKNEDEPTRDPTCACPLEEADAFATIFTALGQKTEVPPAGQNRTKMSEDVASHLQSCDLPRQIKPWIDQQHTKRISRFFLLQDGPVGRYCIGWGLSAPIGLSQCCGGVDHWALCSWKVLVTGAKTVRTSQQEKR